MPLSAPPNGSKVCRMPRTANSVCANRRGFLRYVLLGGTAMGVGTARSQPYKMTKKQSGYIVKDKPATQMCAQCFYFISPNDCVIVQGPISPLGWCIYYGD